MPKNPTTYGTCHHCRTEDYSCTVAGNTSPTVNPGVNWPRSSTGHVIILIQDTVPVSHVLPLYRWFLFSETRDGYAVSKISSYMPLCKQRMAWTGNMKNWIFTFMQLLQRLHQWPAGCHRKVCAERWMKVILSCWSFSLSCPLWRLCMLGSHSALCYCHLPMQQLWCRLTLSSGRRPYTDHLLWLLLRLTSHVSEPTPSLLTMFG